MLLLISLRWFATTTVFRGNRMFLEESTTLQNLTRPALTGAERPRGARLRRGAAAYGVAFRAFEEARTHGCLLS